MYRIAKAPVIVPAKVNVIIDDQKITIEGNKGRLTHILNNIIKIKYTDNLLTFIPRSNCSYSWAQAGTARALVNSMVIGVTNGFTKKLQLVGIGYRVTVTGNLISLFLGFSHPINYQLPINVTAECPSNTEIILSSIDKQIIGQVAANLRFYRPPEPYKGKGIRYVDEIIRIKEAKKK